MALTKAQREWFRSVAESLITRDRPGSAGYRRSLGPVADSAKAQAQRAAFLRYARRAFPRHEFGVSGVEGTGGTSNLRVRAYLAKAA